MCESGETGVEPWLVADWLPWLGASLSLAALEELVKKVLAAPNKIPDMPPIVTCFHELSFSQAVPLRCSGCCSAMFLRCRSVAG